MRAVMDESPGTGTYHKVADGIRARTTPSYVEFEFSPMVTALGPVPLHRVVYVSMRDDTSYLILANLQDLYTAFFRELSRQPKGNQNAFLESLPETWPIFTEGLVNGLNETYHPANVMVLEDPDIASPSWFVVTIVGNVDPASQFSDNLDRIAEAMDRILSISVALILEKRTQQFASGKLSWRMFRNSVASDVKGTSLFIRDNLPALLQALND